MLGKTAGGLFWMFRFLERSENTARLVDAGFRIALTRSAAAEAEWASVIGTAGVRKAYLARYDEIRAGSVIDFLLRDPTNPSSVMSAIDSARTNARLVRTALTREVWEATNECWMTIKAVLKRPVQYRASAVRESILEPAHPGECRDPDGKTPSLGGLKRARRPIDCSCDLGPGIRRDERMLNNLKHPAPRCPWCRRPGWS